MPLAFPHCRLTMSARSWLVLLLAALTPARGTARAQAPPNASAECAAIPEVPNDTIQRIVYFALGNPLPRVGAPLREWSEILLQEVAAQFRTPATITVRELTIAPFYVQDGAPPERLPGLTGDLVARVERGGRVALASIASSTGSPEIDDALLRALAAVDSLQLVPPFPEKYRETAAVLRLRVSTSEPTHPAALPLFRVSLPITRATSQYVPADKLSGPTPKYPRTLLGQGIEGKVFIQFVIDREGRMDPSTLRVLAATHQGFVEAVTRVLPAWRFKPARVGRCPVRQLVKLPFEFAIAKASPRSPAFGIDSQFPPPLRTP